MKTQHDNTCASLLTQQNCGFVAAMNVTVKRFIFEGELK